MIGPARRAARPSGANGNPMAHASASPGTAIRWRLTSAPSSAPPSRRTHRPTASAPPSMPCSPDRGVTNPSVLLACPAGGRPASPDGVHPRYQGDRGADAAPSRAAGCGPGRCLAGAEAIHHDGYADGHPVRPHLARLPQRRRTDARVTRAVNLPAAVFVHRTPAFGQSGAVPCAAPGAPARRGVRSLRSTSGSPHSPPSATRSSSAATRARLRAAGWNGSIPGPRPDPALSRRMRVTIIGDLPPASRPAGPCPPGPGDARPTRHTGTHNAPARRLLRPAEGVDEGG